MCSHPTQFKQDDPVLLSLPELCDKAEDMLLVSFILYVLFDCFIFSYFATALLMFLSMNSLFLRKFLGHIHESSISVVRVYGCSVL